jgi:hypothetical protein
MKYLKIFEVFDKEDAKTWKLVSKLVNMEIIYDLKDLSLELLDKKFTNIGYDYDDDVPEKELIFDVMIETTKGYCTSILNGYFSHSENNLMDNLILPNSAHDVESYMDGKYIIKYIIGIRLNGSNPELISEDTSSLCEKISIIYPDVDFDTPDPWDIG